MATSSRLRRPLRVYAEAEGERHATWLELFFDLVMVVAVAELAHVLHDDLSLAGAATYVGLFVPVWLALAVSELEWTPAATAAALSFITVAGLWWLYFDHVDEGAVTRGAAAASFGDLWPSYVHGYGHLVIFAALGAVGVGAEYAVEHADDDHLGLGGRLALLAGIGAFLLVATAQQRVSAEPIGSRLVVGRLAGSPARRPAACSCPRGAPRARGPHGGGDRDARRARRARRQRDALRLRTARAAALGRRPATRGGPPRAGSPAGRRA